MGPAFEVGMLDARNRFKRNGNASNMSIGSFWTFSAKSKASREASLAEVYAIMFRNAAIPKKIEVDSPVSRITLAFSSSWW